jgi:hypothetical protein
MMASKLLSNGYIATPPPSKSQGAPTSPRSSTSRWLWTLRRSRGWRTSATTRSTPGSGVRSSSSTTFRGAITHAGTHHDLAQCKHERNKLLRSYTSHFFDIYATIANISKEDIIDWFYNGITDPGIYIDFGRNRPKTVAGLRDMMHNWSELEEKMRERFARCNDSNLRCPNDNRTDKSQRDYSNQPRKRKPDDLIAAVDRPSRGKKTTTLEEFKKLLQKKCP